MHRHLALPLLLVASVAHAGTVEAPAPVPTTEATGGGAAEAVAPIYGTYAMQQTFTSQMREPNPFSNKEWRSTHTHTWALVNWQQTGPAVNYTETVCGLRTDPVFGATTTYPDAFIRAIEVRRRSAILASNEPGAVFKVGPYAQSFGVKLTDPLRETLPTDVNDARIVDTDGDGQPGVTVQIAHPMVGSGEVYVAQRSVVRLEGTLQADGKIRGFIYTAPDMMKLGANKWWLKVDSPQRQHPDPAQRPFVLVPVPNGTTCANILSQVETLFPN